jgi:hypothetical protein
MGRRTIRNEKGSMSDQPRVTLHGGPKIADGMTLPLPRLVQGIYVYGTLTSRQVSILVGRYLRSATLEQLAEEHGCSRGTADNELRRAHAILREGLTSDDDQPLVLKNLLDLASEE